jgi:hypothetical protein
MSVIATSLGIGQRRSHRHPILRRLLRLVLPVANPDFESLYPSVQLWWVELNASGVPQREVGFNASGEPVVAGPLGQNFGFWTDSPMTFSVGEHPQVAEQAFAEVWASFERRWNAHHASSAA